ncbi:MAG: LPXTG cell wall anchor domain-containing protein [Acidimicrobiales bacterium]
MNQPSRRRHALVGLASMVAGAVILVAAPLGNAGATAQQQPTPSTSVVDGNPTCGDLVPAGTSWIELKVEPVEDGTFTEGMLTVTVDVSDTPDGPVVDWTSNIGVDAVFVKGGPNGTLYLYDPPAESTGDTGLHAPVNPNNGKFFGLSHLSFCYDEDRATTTTTEEETTTTTEKETTTTTEKETTTTTGGPTTTTTMGESTTTTAMGDVTTTTVAPSDGLPRTGSTAGPMLGLGAALLAGGAALVGYARRFRAS